MSGNFAVKFPEVKVRCMSSPGAFALLLQGDESISVDFATQLQRIIALGFNTVELPFSFKGLQGGSPSKIPTNCVITPYEQILVPLPLSSALQNHIPNLPYMLAA